jgi:hypothetical protein
MKSGLTYIIFVIDRSGSMSSIRADMIGGFNAFIKSQQDAKIGTCRVFAYKFDTTYEPMFEDIDLYQCPLLDNNNYEPRGGTALYDSLGKTIVDIGVRLESTSEEERPEKVLVVTITDGEDNSHLETIQGLKRYTSQEVKDMVEHQKSKYNWDFAYIGANQDAWAVGSSMGYSAGTTLNYVADSAGTALAFDMLDRSTTSYRSAARGASFKFAGNDTTEDDDVDVKTKKKVASKKH